MSAAAAAAAASEAVSCLCRRQRACPVGQLRMMILGVRQQQRKLLATSSASASVTSSHWSSSLQTKKNRFAILPHPVTTNVASSSSSSSRAHMTMLPPRITGCCPVVLSMPKPRMHYNMVHATSSTQPQHIRLSKQQRAPAVVSHIRWFGTTTSSDSVAADTKDAATNQDDGNNTNISSSNNSTTIAMPDQDVELRLADLQSTIQRHYQRGDYTQALKVSKDLAQQSSSHFGQDHPATASAYNNLGLMHKLLGDFVEARQYYTSAMRIYAKIVGRDHASYASTLHNLGNLNKSQIHFDTTLKATQRLALVEKALEYLEEALSIRNVELGPEHPHTVATEMAIGSTLATQVLYEYRMVERKNTQQQQQQQQKQQQHYSKKQYVALNSDSITQLQWKAAEDHLRNALQTAIDNPRGRRIESSSQKGSNNKKGNDKKSKKRPSVVVKSEDNKNALFSSIETVSAALAGQNLAVFLKSYAMTLEDTNSAQQDLLRQAQQLYERVLYVRKQLLPKDHPDVYATKYSLAETLDVLGDETAANALRQEILDTYTPPAEEEEEAKGATNAANTKPIVIEKTKVSK